MSSPQMLWFFTTKWLIKSGCSMRFEPISRRKTIDVSISLFQDVQSLTRSYAVDRVLDGCFQLLSLFFMTIGKNNEAPAAYALTSTIKLLLQHLLEVNLYSSKDLDHIMHTLERLRGIVKTAETDSSYSPKLITLLSNRLIVCQGLLDQLLGRLGRLTHDLPAIHEKLISILRSISLANTRTKVGSKVNGIRIWLVGLH
jgi:hypothetical protein